MHALITGRDLETPSCTRSTSSGSGDCNGTCGASRHAEPEAHQLLFVVGACRGRTCAGPVRARAGVHQDRRQGCAGAWTSCLPGMAEALR
jgi:hypothetical protein